MICPQCGAEYRQGFTVCADCEVPLVYTDENSARLERAAPPATPGDPNEDPFCAFWKGDDGRVHAELISVLDSAFVPHKTIRRQDHLFNLNNYPAYQIAVPFSFYERAERAVSDAFGLDTSSADSIRSLTFSPREAETSQFIPKLPVSLAPPADEAIPGPASAGGDSDEFPEDATSEVWSGEDTSLEEMLTASLNENRIYCRAQKIGATLTILVLPADQRRAREIIREVVDSASTD